MAGAASAIAHAVTSHSMIAAGFMNYPRAKLFRRARSVRRQFAAKQ